jgi:hypothetical protein
MAKRQRLYDPAAGQAIRQGGVAATPTRSCAIAARSPAHCSNASTCISKSRDCRRRNCVPMRRPANPATRCANAWCRRGHGNSSARVASTRGWTSRRRMPSADSRRTIRRCWRTRSTCFSCPHARCTASCASRGQLPILLAVPTFLGRMWRRRSGIGAGSGWWLRGWREPTPGISPERPRYPLVLPHAGTLGCVRQAWRMTTSAKAMVRTQETTKRMSDIGPIGGWPVTM